MLGIENKNSNWFWALVTPIVRIPDTTARHPDSRGAIRHGSSLTGARDEFGGDGVSSIAFRP